MKMYALCNFFVFHILLYFGSFVKEHIVVIKTKNVVDFLNLFYDVILKLPSFDFYVQLLMQ